jgi:hypothetical protein
MSTNRYNPSAFLSIQEVDSLVDRALAKDPTLPKEAFAWVLGYGETQYPGESYLSDKTRDYVYGRWSEFRGRGKMASGRRTNNIIGKLKDAAGPHWLANRYNAQSEAAKVEPGSRVWAVQVGYEVIAFVHGGNAAGAVAEAEVTWRWMYPSGRFEAFLVGLGGKRESDTRNGRLMFAMNDKVQKFRDQAKQLEAKADRLADLLNVWAVMNPDQVAAVINAG